MPSYRLGQTVWTKSAGVKIGDVADRMLRHTLWTNLTITLPTTTSLQETKFDNFGQESPFIYGVMIMTEPIDSSHWTTQPLPLSC